MGDTVIVHAAPVGSGAVVVLRFGTQRIALPPADTLRALRPSLLHLAFGTDVTPADARRIIGRAVVAWLCAAAREGRELDWAELELRRVALKIIRREVDNEPYYYEDNNADRSQPG